ncbi:PhzF family phenazine biosynthesis protein [Halococcus saccharolyticus]|uniref:Phenazine biosynthesis protein PhzF family n=1 Tax=Halococcus saccharolyticus DSM 5350 TaxID=1227455 RepID=M0MQK0_9EURY|nr:PhzF family phenazine biosynthesis protein [Halococcus saccharolyticus]EMA46760.1 phenazine biosynthesis protein PhzF family [Halococcus saccharolyticus DSM 5350]
MRTVRTLLVDAFTDEPLAGNTAGVVPEADDLSAAQMQAIARELGASETAFFRSADDADRRVRYFTPTTEVDLCGHATIASHALLREDGTIDDGAHTLTTNVGVLDIEIDGEQVWMTQNDPAIDTVDLDIERVAAALGVETAAIADVDLPLARGSTGLPFLIVPITFLSALGECEPDLAAIETLCESADATGLYAVTFDTLTTDATAHGRMFAPAAGVPEDPVTGTASGAVGAYLRHFEAVETSEMIFEQGHFVDRPGRVDVHIDADAPSGEQVRVGGRASIALDGELAVPEIDEVGVIEA